MNQTAPHMHSAARRQSRRTGSRRQNQANGAMPRPASAATSHGRCDRLRRCAYQAKVMNGFEAGSSNTARAMTGMA
jgi:hypothetical protein